MQDDRQLMNSFKQGDKESFERLIVKYRSNAEAFARQYIFDAYVAEDIVQESFAEIYVGRDRYDDRYSFKTYLFSIIKNKCIDYLRKKRPISLDSIWETACFLPSYMHTPEDAYLYAEEARLLRSRLKELKEDYRTVLYLTELEEMSHKEAAKIMGKNTAQIKILVYRARQKLKGLLEKEV
ncbi:MAG: RNA polymerase sigma factor [Bacillota bacterium]